MDGALRKRLREQRQLHAHKRVNAPHVEFCTKCGKPYERAGRRTSSLCQPCSRKKGES